MRVGMMAKIVNTADILQRASIKEAISEEMWNLAKIRQSVANKSGAPESLLGQVLVTRS